MAAWTREAWVYGELDEEGRITDVRVVSEHPIYMMTRNQRRDVVILAEATGRDYEEARAMALDNYGRTHISKRLACE